MGLKVNIADETAITSSTTSSRLVLLQVQVVQLVKIKAIVHVPWPLP